MLVRIVRNVFYGSENSGTFGVPARILCDAETELFKPHKIGSVPGNAGRMRSMCALEMCACSQDGRTAK
jgi:hypothetical protein